MGVQFDWQADDEHEAEISRSGGGPRARRPLLGVLALVLLVGGWLSYLLLTRPDADELIPVVQVYQDSERAAINTGDRDLFLSLQDRDFGWVAQQFSRARTLADHGAEIIDAEQHGVYLWVTLAAAAGDGAGRHKTFYRWENERLVHSAPDPDFWGRPVLSTHAWGTLNASRRDEEIAPAVAKFVDETVAHLCEARCLRHRLPLDIHLSDSLNPASVPGRISLASPQLTGLTADDEPIPRFWTELEQLLRAHLSPAEIHFAVPYNYRIVFQILADDYMSSISSTKIRLSYLEEMSADPQTLFAAVDGAFLAPDLEMTTGGYIRDLTDFANADESFDLDDFYNAPLYGMRWNNRIWSVPHSVQMSLIYQDEAAYERAGIALPTDRSWTWDDLWSHSTLIQDTTDSGELLWDLVDVSGDTLLSYALTTRCVRAGKIPCTQRMQLEDVQAALEWYRTQISESERMPDLLQVPVADRIHINSAMSAPRVVQLCGRQAPISTNITGRLTRSGYRSSPDWTALRV